MPNLLRERQHIGELAPLINHCRPKMKHTQIEYLYIIAQTFRVRTETVCPGKRLSILCHAHLWLAMREQICERNDTKAAGCVEIHPR